MKLENNVISVETVKALDAIPQGERWTIFSALKKTNAYVHVTDNVVTEQAFERDLVLKDALKKLEKIKKNSKYYSLYIDEERDGAFRLNEYNISMFTMQRYIYYYPDKDVLLLGRCYMSLIDTVAKMTNELRQSGMKVYIALKDDIAFEPISKKEYYKEQMAPKWVYVCTIDLINHVIDTMLVDDKKFEWKPRGGLTAIFCKTESLQNALAKIIDYREYYKAAKDGKACRFKVTGVLAEHFMN